MARTDSIGLFWQDLPSVRAGGVRELGPIPPWDDTGWRPIPMSNWPDIRNAKWISIDTETYDPELNDYGPGWARGKGYIVGVSLCWEGGKLYLPWKHSVETEYNYPEDNVKRYLRHILTGPGVKIGANLTYDIGWLWHENIMVTGPFYDCQFAEALINETSKLALEELGQKYLGVGKTVDRLKEWIENYYRPKKGRWRGDIHRSPVSLTGFYAEDDAELPYRVLMCQWPQLVNRGLLDLFFMECELIPLFIEMRFAGVQIDMPYVETLRDKFTLEIDRLQKEVNYIAGREVQTGSAQSMAATFDALGLQYFYTEPTEKNPNGNPSFTGDFLKTVNHPVAKKIIELKEAMKLLGTFVESYLINSNVNGKVYCSFNQVSGTEGGTRTGRLSSSNPNLQNIPVRTEAGRLIRQAFIMDHGHLRVRDGDYSQIEYRMLAHFATGPGSDAVRAKYISDPSLDYHKMIGALITEITGQLLARGHVKTINFGLVYGLGIAMLAVYLGVPLEEAKSLSKTFHTAVPFAKHTMESVIEEVNRTGIVETILGRQSHFDLWEPEDWHSRKGSFPLPYAAAKAKYGSSQIIRAYTYRAVNYRLQGSAADVMKKAMWKNYVDGVYAETGVPRLQVHDENFFSDPGDVRQETWDTMVYNMENSVPQVRVPLKFDMGMGMNWGEAH